MKTEKRKKMFSRNRQSKANAMKSPGFKSRYGSKRVFLVGNGGWGWEYKDKPWNMALKKAA